MAGPFVWCGPACPGSTLFPGHTPGISFSLEFKRGRHLCSHIHRPAPWRPGGSLVVCGRDSRGAPAAIRKSPMPSVLLSGPAGSGKSQEAKKLLDQHPELLAIVDFQSIYVALTGDQRGPDGKFPLRNPALLPLTEFARRVLLTAARERELPIVATNSDGDPDRRAFLLRELGPAATEQIADPGEEIVKARLSDPQTGKLSTECNKAVGRWYSRLRR